MRNVLEYLEHSASIYPEKIAAVDQENSCYYMQNGSAAFFPVMNHRETLLWFLWIKV